MDTVLFGGPNTTLTTADKWASPTGYWLPSVASQSESLHKFSPAGKIKHLRIKLSVAPGAGESRTFEYYKGVTATGVSVTISGTDTTGEDLSNTYTVAAGTNLYIKMTSTAGATLTTVRWSSMFTGDVSGESPLFCSSVQTLSAGGTQYLSLAGHLNGVNIPAVEAEALCVIPTDGVLKNMVVHLFAPPGSTKSRQFQLLLNGSATALDLTISGTTLQLTDTSSVSVSKGDVVSVKTIPTNSPAISMVWIGFTFVADTVGEFIIPSARSSLAFHTTLTRYHSVDAHERKVASAVSLIEQLSGDAFELRNIAVDLSTAPGAGNKYGFWFLENGVQQGLQMFIEDTATAGQLDINADIAAGALVATRVLPRFGPASSQGTICYTGFIAEPAPPSDVSAMMMGANF